MSSHNIAPFFLMLTMTLLSYNWKTNQFMIPGPACIKAVVFQVFKTQV